jgi:hypothetical protein
VFVTGSSKGPTGDFNYATVAYDASTGTKLWVTRYDKPGDDDNETARALEVSPDGSSVFVTGFSFGSNRRVNYATVAYNASTGSELWVKRTDGSTNYIQGAAPALGVSPDGTAVFVTGGSSQRHGRDYSTLAYDASTGAELWVQRYDGPASRSDRATAIGVSFDGSKVFVTGQSLGSTGGSDYATVAYAASDGTELWVQRYDGPANLSDRATDLGVSSDGSKVFATGFSVGTMGFYDYATVAYDAFTGNELWVKRYNGPANRNDVATATGVSPDGSELFVTGTSKNDYATVAYATSSGAELWVQRYDGPANDSDRAADLGVNSDGSKVFVTGSSQGATYFADYATLAYGTA